MFYVGIDIGKRTHVASVMSDTVRVLLKGFSLKNTTEGGELLLEHLKRFSINLATFLLVWKLLDIIGRNYFHSLTPTLIPPM